ncbi:MAG: hypothetical protein HOY71_21075, partial [Nonomuraea sp.]|nr:hypothetical protein [Nonomuraea sp.]
MDAIRSLQDACIAATGLALAFRLPPLFRTPREVTAATLVRGLACLEAIFLVGHPDLYGIVYRALGGVPALPQFLQHLAALLLAYQARIFMIQVTGSAPPGRRAERRRLAAWAVALTTCYALGPLRAGLPMLDPRGSADGGVVAYVVLWQSALAVVLVDAVRRGLRHAVTGGTG